ncbi:hypothetical protein [Flavobacterium sp.]|uniref:hypothetical protein n=1 Tax=Flavobacterium sp. TaxID=239 RepID=UPI00286D7AAB|nr:hypothetical protein [Flavobacterium sp.]
MDLYNYSDVIEYLNKNIGFSDEEIYDFKKQDLSDNFKDIFGKYFFFCQTNLLEENQKFNIYPASFYFKNDSTNNAAADYYENGFYLININEGFFYNLYEIFLGDNNLFKINKTLQELLFLNNGNKISVNYLMFQASTLFTFYHELGHLIQYSGMYGKSSNLNNSESYKNDAKPFDFNNHLMEYDSDLYGASYVLNHILIYFDELDYELKNTQNYEKTLSLGLSSIIINFLLLLGKDYKSTKVFYRETYHPHIYIRIFYIMDHFISNSVDEKYEVKSNNVLKSSIDIVSQFFPDGNLILKNLFNSLLNDFDNIKKYYDDIYDGSEKLMYLAKHKQQV